MSQFHSKKFRARNFWPVIQRVVQSVVLVTALIGGASLGPLLHEAEAVPPKKAAKKAVPKKPAAGASDSSQEGAPRSAFFGCKTVSLGEDESAQIPASAQFGGATGEYACCTDTNGKGKELNPNSWRNNPKLSASPTSQCHDEEGKERVWEYQDIRCNIPLLPSKGKQEGKLWVCRDKPAAAPNSAALQKPENDGTPPVAPNSGNPPATDPVPTTGPANAAAATDQITCSVASPSDVNSGERGALSQAIPLEDMFTMRTIQLSKATCDRATVICHGFVKCVIPGQQVDGFSVIACPPNPQTGGCDLSSDAIKACLAPRAGFPLAEESVAGATGSPAPASGSPSAAPPAN